MKLVPRSAFRVPPFWKPRSAPRNFKHFKFSHFCQKFSTVSRNNTYQNDPKKQVRPTEVLKTAAFLENSKKKARKCQFSLFRGSAIPRSAFRRFFSPFRVPCSAFRQKSLRSAFRVPCSAKNNFVPRSVFRFFKMAVPLNSVLDPEDQVEKDP